MAGTAVLQYLSNEIGLRWNADIDGRVEPVPRPDIYVEGTHAATRADQSVNDMITVQANSEEITPKSVGYNHEESSQRVSIDMRTNNGRKRLTGTRDSNNERERYGGLRGETKRILEQLRKGDAEYDLVMSSEWRDLSADVGYAFHRGVIEVELREVAREIDPTP